MLLQLTGDKPPPECLLFLWWTTYFFTIGTFAFWHPNLLLKYAGTAQFLLHVFRVSRILAVSWVFHCGDNLCC